MTEIKRILVVEDQPLLLLELADQLAELGYDVRTAGSARTASYMMDQTVDGLVTDIELGDGPDGLVLARLAARTRPRLPIVVVSGGVRPAAAQLPPGAVFLPKPYLVADIVAALCAQQTARAA
ncbi:response regulator [uncultured Devosia sp.]|uniref:response regulator n=1 Tax=uncultured Devosia sp. TaxID=211434 RepID=UPI00262F8072|nr:response regulator [uncultured Devosia sp.]